METIKDFAGVATAIYRNLDEVPCDLAGSSITRRRFRGAMSPLKASRTSWLVAACSHSRSSSVFYWTIAGYAIAALPIAVRNLNRDAPTKQRQWVAAAGVALLLVLVALGVFLRELGQQVFFVVGLVVGAFCTHMHFKIADMILEHLEAGTKTKTE
ncbi:hypothetical protein ACHHYP_11736 [Achlya hypogyna]|uniref:Uncharacterized protein n=1 Tax=Achlya hypogyna TaxID=1202772 RepID=A0A1V9YIG4_ACHHY|nr:hypothetical protein ACHHYP_11736 [Achlya hypogyna]